MELYLHKLDRTVVRKGAVINRPDQNRLTLKHRYSNRFCPACTSQESIGTGKVSGFDRDLVQDKSVLYNVYTNSIGRGTLSRMLSKIPGKR